MSLLLGAHDDPEVNAWLRGYMLNSDGQRKRPEWMQIHPQSWKPIIEKVLGQDLVRKTAAPEEPAPPTDENGKVVELTRVNFKFNEKKFHEYLSGAGPLPESVLPTTSKMFDSIQGHVVPKFFWKDAAQFARGGKAFSFIADGMPVSTAFSAFVAPGILEIGIETVEGHRGNGYAEQVCRALIGHCLGNHLEPVWSCRLENTGSFNMARKLGFEPTVYTPFYKLTHG
jgi:RimJ/RimL family protein N-acetyltransferase